LDRPASDRAEALLRQAERAYQEAAKEAIEKTEGGERERLEALRRQFTAAQGARDRMDEARRAAKASTVRVAAERFEREGETALGRREYWRARELLEQAWVAYGGTAHEGLDRYPTIEAPSEVAVGQEFAVQVSLTEARFTPEVRVPSGPTTPEGAVRLRPPSTPGQDAWTIDVVLSARGFRFRHGANSGWVTLPRRGDSTPAVFHLHAEPISESRATGTLYATFWHEGNYIARVARDIAVAAEPTSPALRRIEVQRPQRAARVEPERQPADLTLLVRERDDTPGRVDIIVMSPYLQPVTQSLDLPRGLSDWLDAHYDRFVAELGRGASKEATLPLLRGFGRELYRRLAPSAFKEAFWRLQDALGPGFRSVQILSNNPLLPWELMRPSRADGSDERDFLGIEYRVARWHLGEAEALLDRAPQTVPLKELVVIAPEYGAKEALPSQTRELRALQAVPGFRRVAGRLARLQGIFQQFPEGIVHFAGHGLIRPTRPGLLEYVMRLEDAELDLLGFRGLRTARPTTHPFIFFNACSLGQARRVTRFVDGWAPAVLEAGASGYVGGLWLLSDAGAAEFAVHFYRALAGALDQGPVLVADILQQVRRRVYETGDPTFLAYVYYGDPQFRLIRPDS
jgi:hypothetical protein